MSIRVFWLEPTTYERVRLRRYKAGSECPMPWRYHDRSVVIGDRPQEGHAIEDPDVLQEGGVFSAPTKDDLRWPTHCDCGYRFQPEDTWQVFPEVLYSGAPDGQLYTLRDAPVGAMWDAEWLHDVEWLRGKDGLSLHIKTPGGDWCPDQECSNCTRTQWEPQENGGRKWTGRTHYCWVRSGDPRLGNVHIDKGFPGESCLAGAGSVIVGGWHGFCHDGQLIGC